MAKILEFKPKTDVDKANMAAALEAALMSHAPETRERKLAAMLDYVDRYSPTDSVSITIPLPPDEPLSQAQLSAISRAIGEMKADSDKKRRDMLTEMILLKLALIDAGCP